jgi:hypothetical protein
VKLATLQRSNWEIKTNDGTNLTALNTKTLEYYTGTTSAFNALMFEYSQKLANHDSLKREEVIAPDAMTEFSSTPAISKLNGCF